MIVRQTRICLRKEIKKKRSRGKKKKGAKEEKPKLGAFQKGNEANMSVFVFPGTYTAEFIFKDNCGNTYR